MKISKIVLTAAIAATMAVATAAVASAIFAVVDIAPNGKPITVHTLIPEFIRREAQSASHLEFTHT